jgi:hypothetical protein
MPNYLVELPESQTYSQLGEGATKMVIFAADAAGARRAAAGRFDGDGNALWNTEASVTELVAGLTLADAGDDGWSLYARISGAAAQTPDPIVASVDGQTKDDAKGILGKTRLHLNGALNSGGVATYVIDDILTAVGGTFTRAATFRVITVSTGVITAIELVDPGEYSVLPATMTANPVSGGGGTAATVDLTQFAAGSYEALIGQMVTEGVAAGLTSSVDLSEGASGTRLFTMSTVGDNIGDGTFEFEVRHNGTVETVLMSTIVHEGIAGAVLTAAIPASPLAPPRIEVFGSHGDS